MSQPITSMKNIVKQKALLNKLKKALIELLDELIDQFPTETDLINFRIYINDHINMSNVVNTIILYFFPHEKKIEQKDEKFFLTEPEIFKDLNPMKVNRFKRLWQSKQLNENDKNAIWNYVSLFVIIAKKYQALQS